MTFTLQIHNRNWNKTIFFKRADIFPYGKLFIFKSIPTWIMLTRDYERQFGGDEPFLIIFSCVFVTFLWGSRLNDLHGQWFSRKPSPHILLSGDCIVVVAVVVVYAATNRIKLFRAREEFKGGISSLWHYAWIFFCR